MIIMALDHAAGLLYADVYFLIRLIWKRNKLAYYFLQRWIVYICAPIFMLLAGTSSYTYRARKQKELSTFFLTLLPLGYG
jgi:uncharacterized membrane protein